ncbi:MAG: hypothetical protein AAGL49_06640 [Pseudomonadota bacterium]
MDRYALVVLVTLVLYKLVLIGIGFFAERLNKDNTDYFLGGRGIGPIVASISYAASSTSSWVLLGYTGFVYMAGVTAGWFVIGTMAGHILGWTVVAPRLRVLSRERNLITVTDLLALGVEGRWRGVIIVTAALAVVFSFQVYVSAQFQGAAITFNTIFGMGYAEALILGGAIVAFYTVLGGFWAVSINHTSAMARA